MSVLKLNLDQIGDIYGRCAAFCRSAIDGDTPPEGAPLDEHGPFCLGDVWGGYGRRPDGGRAELWINPARPYFHGRQTLRETRARYQLERNCAVALFHGDDEQPFLLLSAGEARSLAAELIHIADIDRRLDVPHRRIERSRS